jgi:hypothetical protein
MNRLLVGITIFVLASACAPIQQNTGTRDTYKVTEFDDPAENTTHAWLDGQFLARDRSGNTKAAIALLGYPNIESYMLHIMFNGKDWIFIKQDNSVVINIDGEITRLTAIGTPSRTVGRGYVLEQANYHISPAQIYSIATGTTVYVKVAGSKGSVTGLVPQSTKNSFARLLVEYPITHPRI